MSEQKNLKRPSLDTAAFMYGIFMCKALAILVVMLLLIGALVTYGMICSQSKNNGFTYSQIFKY